MTSLRLLFLIIIASLSCMGQQFITEIRNPYGNLIGVTGAKSSNGDITIEAITLTDTIVFSRFNKFGDSLWTCKIQGVIPSGTYSFSGNKQFTLTSDNGCVFFSSPGNFDYNISKIDSTGQIVWSKNIHAPGDDRFASRVLESYNGDIILLVSNLFYSHVNSVWTASIITLDRNGNFLNMQSFENERADCIDLIQNFDHTYYMCGGNTVVKLDSLFNILNKRKIDTYETLDRIVSVENDTVVMQTLNNTNSSIIVMDTSISSVKQINFKRFDYSPHIIRSKNKNCYFIAGPDSNITVLIQLDQNFDTVRCYSFFQPIYFHYLFNLCPINIIDAEKEIVLMIDSFYSGKSSLFLFQSDSLGNFCQSGTASFQDSVNLIAIVPPWPLQNYNTPYQITPDTLSFSSGLETMKICLETSINNVSFSQPYNIYPNPVLDCINIKGLRDEKKLTFYNLQGQIIYCVQLSQKNQQENFDLREMDPGIYLLQVDEKFIYRIVKLP